MVVDSFKVWDDMILAELFCILSGRVTKDQDLNLGHVLEHLLLEEKPRVEVCEPSFISLFQLLREDIARQFVVKFVWDKKQPLVVLCMVAHIHVAVCKLCLARLYAIKDQRLLESVLRR